MSIQVTSTTNTPEQVRSAAGQAKTGESAEGGHPAPETKKSPEHNEATESGTEANEAEQVEEETESKDESESEDSEKTEDEATKEKPKKKGGFQRRIDKLNAQKSAAQQEAEYWRKMALDAGAGVSKKEPDPKPAATAEGKPDPNNFDTHQAFVEALTDWKTEQKLKERDQKMEKSKFESDQANLAKSYSERAKAFAEKTADYDEVLSEVDDIPVSPVVHELLISSENGPELAYELAKNREEFERLNKLSPLAAARELGKLESKLASKASPKTETKLTKAPKPIEPVAARGGSSVKSIYDPNLSQKDYEKLRAKQRSAG